MNLRQLSLVQWVIGLVRKVFSASAPAPEAPAPEAAEPAPRMLSAKDIQARLAARGIVIQSTLRVLWVKPAPEEDGWSLVYPFSKGPLSVYDSEAHAIRVARELLGREEGGSLVLLGADGEAGREEHVAPLAVEGMRPDDGMDDNPHWVSQRQFRGEPFAVEAELSRKSPEELARLLDARLIRL